MLEYFWGVHGSDGLQDKNKAVGKKVDRLRSAERAGWQ